ncbi:MAG: hypothetical protein ACYSO1_10070 [Planctomycetota bacterium]|jgi:hypothetical protein
MKNFSLTLAMIALMFTSISQAAYTIDRFPVYDGPDDQTNPDIDGDMIVWQSSDTDIYYKHIDAADPNVIAIGGEQVEPKVSDGVIVWLDKADSDHDVYGYDTINELNLTFTENDTYTQREHDISGNTAVYRDNSAGSYNIYTHPIGATAELVAPVASARYEFDIDGSIVAWVVTAVLLPGWKRSVECRSWCATSTAQAGIHCMIRCRSLPAAIGIAIPPLVAV